MRTGTARRAAPAATSAFLRRRCRLDRHTKRTACEKRECRQLRKLNKICFFNDLPRKCQVFRKDSTALCARGAPKPNFWLECSYGKVMAESTLRGRYESEDLLHG